MSEEKIELNTDLTGRIRNTVLSKSKCLFPLFEAIVNSIQAIDECKNNDGKIIVKIIRDNAPELKFDNPVIQTIKSFYIIDNGHGFTNENFESFKTLDSTYKSSKGCKGIGRLLWIKCFESVYVKSIFEENNLKYERSFSFSAEKGLYNVVEKMNSNSDINTIVELNNYNSEYSKYVPKEGLQIAQAILQHCLWFFIRDGGCPQIIVEDGDRSFDLNEQYDNLMIEKANIETLTIKNNEFYLTHVKLNAKIQSQHSLILCAAGREVKKENINGKIIGLYGALRNNGNDFYNVTFVTSEYLDKHVVPERSEFDLSYEKSDFDFENDISISEIESAVYNSIEIFLKSYLTVNYAKGIKRLNDFVDKKAPKYKPLLKRLDNKEQNIDPDISDENLDIQLHKRLAKVEEKVLEEGHDLINQKIEENDFSDYKNRLEIYMSEISDLKQSALAEYVSHRKVILDLLKKAMELQPNDKYVKEEVIHKLIMPMKKTSDDITSDSNNLWLINERLVFHNYLASDKKLEEMPIVEKGDEDRPDLIMLQTYDNPLLTSDSNKLPLASITVIELKRPMRNDMSENDNPIVQSLRYLSKVRKGNCRTKDGRPIPESENIPGFCYIIADITETLKEL